MIYLPKCQASAP